MRIGSLKPIMYLTRCLQKNAWGWAVLISLALARIQFLRGKLQDGFVKRLVWATVYWALLTQNLFGASFREKVFLASGGSCILGEANTLSQCKAYGPNGWVGGHRISGHCLLLIHASLFLWEEFGQMLYMPIPERDERKPQSSADYSPVEQYVIYGARTILVLFLWLLTITCIYFHSFPEKLSGIFFGSLFWGTSYFYIFPALRVCP
ncbi:hypothetical protein DSO57_1011491 [Entomophthora muscae]|uniref:Uncharacterized protein n=1 Tax=Entomophthora muscae TaxID=34485 RepID=A0ACC2TTY2_9FUNG|nr:hypothetical protein DSO57_1011491 [Entomophthora muscae]